MISFDYIFCYYWKIIYLFLFKSKIDEIWFGQFNSNCLPKYIVRVKYLKIFLELEFDVCPLQTPLQTPVQTPLPGTTESSMYNIPTGSTDYSTPNSNEGLGTPIDIKLGAGRPNPYMVLQSYLMV